MEERAALIELRLKAEPLRPALRALSAKMPAWLERVQPILDRIRQWAVALSPFFESLRAVLRKETLTRTFIGNVLLLLVRPDSPEGLAAAERLADTWFHHPVPKARWNLVAPKILERAEVEQQTREQVLRTSVMTAIFLIVARSGKTDERLRVGPRQIRGSAEPIDLPLPDYFRWFRAEVANAICEDFLGPGWRRVSDLPLEEVDPEAERIMSEEMADLALILKDTLACANLTVREAQALFMSAQGYQTPEIADALNVNPSTVRVHRHNARKKLRAVNI